MTLLEDISPPPDRIRRGTRIGSWRIETELGAGAMGHVYGVIHTDIGKRAALKVMHAHLACGLNAERVALEGQVVNHLGHPNIVDIFDAGVFEERPYLVMERLEGMTLAQFAREGRLAPALAIDILLQLCSALSAAHSIGVVHRDLKPDNVFLITRERDVPLVKLLDWGIAKIVADPTRRTMEGQVIGTAEYLAPEQACGRPVSSKTDVYALGVLAFELFVAQLPYAATDVVDLLHMHLHAPPRRPSSWWPGMPPRLEALLLSMLAKNAAARPSISTVMCELEKIRPAVVRRATAIRCAPYLALLGLLGSVGLRLFVPRVVPVAAIGIDVGEPAYAAAAHETKTAPQESPPAFEVPLAQTVRAPQPATTTPAPASAPVVEVPSTTQLLAQYARVGRTLAAERGVIDVDPLWARYRLLRIYEAVRTEQSRQDAAVVLSMIEHALAVGPTSR